MSSENTVDSNNTEIQAEVENGPGFIAVICLFLPSLGSNTKETGATLNKGKNNLFTTRPFRA